MGSGELRMSNHMTTLNVSEQEMVASFEQVIRDRVYKREDHTTDALVFSDWLDEHGHVGYAEVIRFAVEQGKFPHPGISEEQRSFNRWYWWRYSYMSRLPFYKDWGHQCTLEEGVWGSLLVEGSYKDYRYCGNLFDALFTYWKAQKQHWDGLTLFDRLEKEWGGHG